VYPNPVQDQAFIDYKLHTETVKAKIVVHNVLGKAMGDYELAFDDTRVKIQADDLVPGIYFYTVYLNNNGILTRKLIVRK
ncbi:MAG: T9SS type A sorting domain-containing protein, partial [Bacteroidota bacterium]